MRSGRAAARSPAFCDRLSGATASASQQCPCPASIKRHDQDAGDFRARHGRLIGRQPVRATLASGGAVACGFFVFFDSQRGLRREFQAPMARASMFVCYSCRRVGSYSAPLTHLLSSISPPCTRSTPPPHRCRSETPTPKSTRRRTMGCAAYHGAKVRVCRVWCAVVTGIRVSIIF